jgi:hypothetical protein
MTNQLTPAAARELIAAHTDLIPDARYSILGRDAIALATLASAGVEAGEKSEAFLDELGKEPVGRHHATPAKAIQAVLTELTRLRAELEEAKEYIEAARSVVFLMGGCECLCVCADKEYLAGGAHCQFHAIQKRHREAWQKYQRHYAPAAPSGKEVDNG